MKKVIAESTSDSSFANKNDYKAPVPQDQKVILENYELCT
jgi:hypothetical protein